ncbi:MAG: thiamine-binding protein [Acidimicrobiales bacterium]
MTEATEATDAATLEFTIEPFVPARPGRHVTASIEAAESAATSVEVGPFGTTASAPVGRIGVIAAAVIDAAMSNGASRVSLQVTIDGAQ